MAKKKANTEVVTALKGFDRDWQCRNFQYEVGGTYKHDGEVVRCAEGGFHSCEYPLDVFAYYPPADSVYAIVEAGGAIDRDDDGDSKIASAEIHIKAEIKIPDLVRRSVDWLLARIDDTKTETNTGDWSAATNTGDRSAATNTGDRSAAEVGDNGSVAIATGYQSKAKAGTGSAIVLCYRDDEMNLIHIRAAIVGQDGIKPDTFYTLNADGEFEEA